MPDNAPRFKPNEDVPGDDGARGSGGGTASATVPPLNDTPKQRGPGMRKLENQVAEFYETIAVVAVMPFDRLAGGLLHARSRDLAETWIDLAERDPRVKRTLERLMEATGWGGVVMVHAAIIIPVVANRGLLPDAIAGGAAAMTILQNPEVAPLFDHERWQQNQQPTPSANGNANGNV